MERPAPNKAAPAAFLLAMRERHRIDLSASTSGSVADNAVARLETSAVQHSLSNPA